MIGKLGTVLGNMQYPKPLETAEKIILGLGEMHKDLSGKPLKAYIDKILTDLEQKELKTKK